MAELSTKPYLIRAIHAWCTDSGYRPYIAVVVDERTVVPREYVRNGEIVLNVSDQATNRLQISNELVEFEARFSGVVRSVSIPIDNVSAIYAQETGHGMAFDVPKPLALAPQAGPSTEQALPADEEEVKPPAPAGKQRAMLSAVPATGPSVDDSSVTEAPRKSGRSPRAVERNSASTRVRAGDAADAAGAPPEGDATGQAGGARAKSNGRRLRSVKDGQGKPAAEPSVSATPSPLPEALSSSETPPDEPPPAGRPYLKRVK